jgi:hypothetical protein
MPVISKFYGITIRMYFQQSEHNPPHIHAIYGEQEAAISIRNREVLDGELPIKAVSLIKEWIDLYEEELLYIWETQNFVKLPPLE